MIAHSLPNHHLTHADACGGVERGAQSAPPLPPRRDRGPGPRRAQLGGEYARASGLTRVTYEKRLPVSLNATLPPPLTTVPPGQFHAKASEISGGERDGVHLEVVVLLPKHVQGSSEDQQATCG